MSIVANPLERNPLEIEPITEWPEGLPNHLSASQIGMWQRCREQWRRRYVKGEKERPGAALVWGSADHKAHETNFAQKITSGEDISGDDVKLAFADAFDSQVDKYGGTREVEWGNEKPSELKDAGVRLVGAYHNSISPYVQPTSVEERFEVTVPKVPVPVVGYIDVQTADSAIERKTAKAATRKVKPQWRLQGLLYQAIKSRPVNWHVSVKTKTPAVWTPDLGPNLSPELRLGMNDRIVSATQVLVQHAARDIAAYMTAYGPDEPWEGALSHDWACSFCGFKSTCFWWGN
jgi:hypothetical protein